MGWDEMGFGGTTTGVGQNLKSAPSQQHFATPRSTLRSPLQPAPLLASHRTYNKGRHPIKLTKTMMRSIRPGNPRLRH